MKSAIDLLCECTMTTSVPAVSPGPATVILPAAAQQPTPQKSKKSKLADPLAKRKLRQEGTEPQQGVIPSDAVPDDSSIGGIQGGAGQPATVPKGTIEPPIPTAVALVAPDTTPNSEAPLDPSQVPAPAAAPMEQPVVSSPTPISNGNDVMRTLLGTHQSNFKPDLITTPAQAAEAVNKMLNGDPIQEHAKTTGAAAVVEAKASASAAALMSAAQEGKATKPHHNPDSMNRAIAVTRQLLDL